MGKNGATPIRGINGNIEISATNQQIQFEQIRNQAAVQQESLHSKDNFRPVFTSHIWGCIVKGKLFLVDQSYPTFPELAFDGVN